MAALGWFIAALLFLVVEMSAPGWFFFACLGVGALAGCCLTLLGAGAGWVWGGFGAVSTGLVLVAAPLARRLLRAIPRRPVGYDALAGQHATVLEDLDPEGGAGLVQLPLGAQWLAVAQAFVPAGAQVEVVAVSGTRLLVRPIPQSPVSEDR